jgi:hypothetical protein
LLATGAARAEERFAIDVEVSLPQEAALRLAADGAGFQSRALN